MSKIFRVIRIVTALAVLGFSVTSCDVGSSGGDDLYGVSLIGTWLASEEAGGYTMAFTGCMTSGGNVDFIERPGHGSYTAYWFVDGNLLTISGYSWFMHTGTYFFSISGDTLTLRDFGSDDRFVYTRQTE